MFAILQYGDVSPFGLGVREPKSRNEIQSVGKTNDFYF